MRSRLCIILLAIVPMRAEKEAALGAHLAQEVRRKITPIDIAALSEYVQWVGKMLATQLPDAGLTCTFAMIADNLGGPTHEPLSIPGGYIFISGSLILAAQNETEFAGMLAHSMAHVAERHGTRQATRGRLGNAGSIPLIFLGAWTGMGAGGAASAVPLAFLSDKRRFETEADMLAVKMTSGAGYDPEALVRYIGRVQPQDNDRSGIFSELPARDSRITGMQKAIQALPPKTYFASDEFPGIQDEVRRVLPAKAPRPPSLKKPAKSPRQE